MSGKDNQQEIRKGIENIADKIRQTKQDMHDLEAEQAGKEHIEGAHLELDEVIKATEEASNRIMDAAEKIQALASGNAEIAAQVTDIFEACSFQDITGQRIRKVVGLLSDIEKSIEHLMEVAGVGVATGATSAAKKADGKGRAKTVAEQEKELLRGPQLGKDMPSQDDIDKLFSSS